MGKGEGELGKNRITGPKKVRGWGGGLLSRQSKKRYISARRGERDRREMAVTKLLKRKDSLGATKPPFGY